MSDVSLELSAQRIYQSFYHHHDSILKGCIAIRPLIPEVYYQLDNVISIWFYMDTNNLRIKEELDVLNWERNDHHSIQSANVLDQVFIMEQN